MKKKLPLIIEIILGIILICVSYFIMDTDYYSAFFLRWGLVWFLRHVFSYLKFFTMRCRRIKKS